MLLFRVVLCMYKMNEPLVLEFFFHVMSLELSLLVLRHTSKRSDQTYLCIHDVIVRVKSTVVFKLFQ